MPALNGTSSRVPLSPGYTLVAPGLRGIATAHAGRTTGTGTSRGIESATPALDDALRAAGINEIQLVELSVIPTPPPLRELPLRNSAGQDALVLEVPDLGDTVGQIVMAVDEEGVVTWHFPEPAPQASAATRGANGTRRFVIQRAVGAPDATGATTRGLVQTLGKKLLKVLVYPLFDPVLGTVIDKLAAAWEAKNRPYGVRTFAADDYRGPGTPLDAAAWERLGAGRALLFVHGTFSTAAAAFGALPSTTMERLQAAYDGRVFAFDHFTLSDDPDANVAWFLSQVPAGTSLDIDIVCHSRGGLVARALALALEKRGSKLGRLVFVAAPNEGTLLVAPDHIPGYLDRMTTVLNLLPPGPGYVVAEILEAVLTVVKVVGHAGLAGLDGLAAMAPGGRYLAALGENAEPIDRYFSISAEYGPTGTFGKLLLRKAGDALIDRVFEGAPNDLVVPTLGVFEGFPLPAARVRQFPASEGVSHTTYFSQPDTSAWILDWLG